MKLEYNPRYPSVEDLRNKAKKRIPGFAFDYLDGGCNEEINLYKNTSEIREVELLPQYLKKHAGSDMKTELFGHVYDAPFGIAPVGLQGLIWPNSPEILAKAAFKHNIPFTLSTVSTSTIERISEITEGQAWFQLYHPAENTLRDQIIKRASEHCPVLVILSDVPTFGYRNKEIKNGLAMPPRMTLHNVVQIMGRPNWALKTLIHGQPSFKVMKPYMPKGMNMHHLGLFMNKTFNGRLNEDKISAIRDMWKGKLVLKGIVNEIDVEKSIQLGIDGIIVSNHGGRQLDGAVGALDTLNAIATAVGDKTTILFDSGIRRGADVFKAMALGAKAVLIARPYAYALALAGEQGVKEVVGNLLADIDLTLGLAGCTSWQDVSKDRLLKV